MIEYRRVSKTFPGGQEAVKDFSLTIPSGSMTVLVGSSGCGKTTLLRMVNRMVEPTSGSVEIDGSDVREKDPVELRRSIGYVMQSGGAPSSPQCAGTTFRPCPCSREWIKRDSKDRALELMDLVGLDSELGPRYPQQLSGGQQQRVGVARALAVDPTSC
jgi:ABC-type proline/glycine betaine transport systems, ATPase components